MLFRPSTILTRSAPRSLLSSSRAFVAAPASVNSKVWELGVLNHVAIATPNLEKATAFYRDILKGKCSEQIALPEHGVTTVFVNLGNTKIELLHPLGDKSPIAGFLAKNKEGGMHHICLEVDNVYTAMADVKEKGIRVLDKEPKIGAHGKPVVFLHPKKKNKRSNELKPWCWYCDRSFDDEKILIDHQRAKHLKCTHCNKKMNTAGGLVVHCMQVHKEVLIKLENTLPGRESVEVEIFGMEGIPEADLQAHIAAVGGGSANKRVHIDANPDSLKEQLAAFQAQKEALSAASGAPPPGFPGMAPP
ncbi:UNVERIFIED_CONTAM: hypothetical protein HDU68_006628, partial [Siphonaria sp. JEL0065]